MTAVSFPIGNQMGQLCGRTVRYRLFGAAHGYHGLLETERGLHLILFERMRDWPPDGSRRRHPETASASDCSGATTLHGNILDRAPHVREEFN